MIKQCDKIHYPLCVSADQEMIESITDAEMWKKMTVKRSKNLKRNHCFVWILMNIQKSSREKTSQVIAISEKARGLVQTVSKSLEHSVQGAEGWAQNS